MRSRLLSLLATVAVLSGGIVLVAGRGSDDTYTITADVVQAPSLFVNGRVMVRGVRVGTITGVEPRADGVRVTMAIDPEVRLPAEARLNVVPITVIADRYVQIEPAYTSGAAMEDGDHIALEDTTIPAELDDVLEQLQGLMAALEPRRGKKGPLAKLIDSLDVALAGRSRELGGTIEGGAAVLGNLAANEARLTGLISNLDRLFVALADRSSEIGLVNARLASVTQALAEDREHLEGTIENIAFLSSQAGDLVNESGDELGVAFARLDRVLTAVLAHEEQLAAGMRWTNVIAQGLGATDAAGRGVYAYSGRQSRPEYSYRIDTRDTIGCERLELLTERFRQINPSWGLMQVLEAAMDHLAESYRDDLEWIVEDLILLCSDLQGTHDIDAEARRIVEDLATRMGPERFARAIARSRAAGGGR